MALDHNLNLNERRQIQRELEKGTRIEVIAAKMNRSYWSIYREIRRNRADGEPYNAEVAEDMRLKRVYEGIEKKKETIRHGREKGTDSI